MDPVSVVVPAHNEERVLGRCLSALLDGDHADSLDVVVVCNGCSDATAEVARRAGGGRVRVLEIPVASKAAALDLGDEAAHWFPRFYVDADVVVTLETIRELASVLRSGVAMAVSPRMHVDTTGRPFTVRAYHQMWSAMPYVRQGPIAGVIGLSEEGRRRFGAFPDVIADDLFLAGLFAHDERRVVDHVTFTVLAPANVRHLVRRRARASAGAMRYRAAHPESAARLAPAAHRPWGRVALRPTLWPAAGIYMAVWGAAQWRARAMIRTGDITWNRDDSSRIAEHAP